MTREERRRLTEYKKHTEWFYIAGADLHLSTAEIQKEDREDRPHTERHLATFTAVYLALVVWRIRSSSRNDWQGKNFKYGDDRCFDSIYLC